MKWQDCAQFLKARKLSFTVIIFILVFLAFTHWIWLGYASPIWDAHDWFAAFFSLVSDFARAGKICFWSPWTEAGMPVFIEPQAGALSPLTVALAFLFGGAEVGFRFYWLSIWCFGGLGMLFFTRHLQAPLWASLCLAIGFCASGIYTGNAEHLSWIHASSFIPWIAWRFDCSLQTKNIRPALQAGVLFGASVLGGYPAIAFATAFFVGCWGVFRTIDLVTPAYSWKSGMAHLVTRLILFSIVGALVFSPLVFAMATEGGGYTHRAAHFTKAVSLSQNALEPSALFTLASPLIVILKFFDPKLWPNTDISSASMFLGTVPLVLAVVGLLLSKRKWLSAGWLVLALLAYLAACSMYFPLRAWLYDYISPTRYFRHSSMFRIFIVFSFCGLAALGAKELSSNAHGQSLLRLKRVLISIALIGVCVAGLTLYLQVNLHGAKAPKPLVVSSSLHFLTVWATIIISTYLFYRGKIGRVPLIISWVGVTCVESVLTIYISQGTMFDLNEKVRQSWDELNDQHVLDLNLGLNGMRRQKGEQTNHNLISKVPTLENYSSLFNRYMQQTYKSKMLSQMAQGPQRLWMASQPAVLPVTDSAFKSLKKAIEESHKPFVVLHTRREMLAQVPPQRPEEPKFPLTPIRKGVAAPQAYSVLEYSPDRLDLSFTSSRAGWLMVTDRWAKSWTAKLDGKPAEIWGANFLYRGVFVGSPGPHTLTFEYDPWMTKRLLTFSWAVCFLVLAESVMALFSQPALVVPVPMKGSA